MDRRRKILVAVIAVAVVGTAISAAVPRTDRAVKPTDLPPGPALVDPSGGQFGDGVVRGALPAEEVVRAEVGDLVELTVTADGPDSAAIEGLGLVEALAPGAPARFSFLADRPGSFPVTLTISDDRAGRIIVERPDEDSDEASPGSPDSSGTRR